MKLLYIHECFGAQGGAEANVLLTARAFQQRGHTVGLAHGPGTGRGEADWAATFTRRYPITELATAVADFQPDALYVHNASNAAAVLATGRPVVQMVHDHNLYCLRTYKYHYFSRQVCHRACSLYCVFPCGASLARRHGPGFPIRWVSYWAKRRELALHRRFTRLLVASDYMKSELLRNDFPVDRIETHPLPLTHPPTGTSTFSDRNLILFTGQILRGKGVDVLLESLALLRTPFECIILGDGSHRAECEQLSARLGLTDRVHFRGFVPQAELPAYFREATVSVMSSVWPEPFGMSGVEALAQGIPVVAFDVGGIRQWLDDGRSGFVVPWMDRPAFAAKIETLLRDKALARRLGETGRQQVTERFDLDRYIASLETTFRSVIAAPAAQ